MESMADLDMAADLAWAATMADTAAWYRRLCVSDTTPPPEDP